MDATAFRAAVVQEYAAELTARRLHAATTVTLGYCNIPLHITADGFDPAPILGHGSLVATNLERLLLGGIKVIVWSPGIPWWTPAGAALAGRAKVRFIQQQLQVMNDLGHLSGGRLAVARNVRDIRRINAAGGVAILLHLSGVNHLNDLGILREYYDLGVRLIHCGFQDWPDASPAGDTVRFDPATHVAYHAGRLNPHGVRTLAAMQDLGIIVDVAHLNDAGFDDVVSRLDGRPFVYSHGACAALYRDPNHRNFDDARIARVAASGGVYGIGVCLAPPAHAALPAEADVAGWGAAVAAARRARTAAAEAAATDVRDFLRRRYDADAWQYLEERELTRVGGCVLKGDLAQVVAHLRHLRDTFGPAVAGYGPDYEFTYQYVRGLEEADKTPALTRALLAAGFSPADTQAALGENFLRVFAALIP